MRSRIVPPRTNRPSSGDEAALGKCTVRTLPARRPNVRAPRAAPPRAGQEGGGGGGGGGRGSRVCGREGARLWVGGGSRLGDDGGGRLRRRLRRRVGCRPPRLRRR